MSMFFISVKVLLNLKNPFKNRVVKGDEWTNELLIKAWEEGAMWMYYYLRDAYSKSRR